MGTVFRRTVWLVLLLGGWTLFAEASGRTGATALNLGVGARAEAMGGAFVGVADDVSAVYWNPAGIGLIRGSQFTGTHTEWLGGIRYEWVGFTQPIGSWATLGIGAKFLLGGDVPHTVRTPSGFEERGTFRYATRHFQLVAGSREFDRIRFGAGLEVLREELAFSSTTSELSGRSAGANLVHLGALYRTPLNGLRVGASMRNLGGGIALYDTSFALPRVFQIGLGYERRIEAVSEEDIPVEIGAEDRITDAVPANWLVAALDFRFLREEKPSLRVGVEYRFRNGFALRAGYRSDGLFDFVSKASGGIGYATESYKVDYAYVPMGDLGATHRVAFTLLFR